MQPTSTTAKMSQTSFKDKANQVLGVRPEDAIISKSYLFVAFTAVLLGGLLGLLQGLNRAGLLQLPTWLNYYQVLTAHGLLLVVVFSATFVIGYFYAGMSHTLGGLLPKVRKMVWTGFWLKIVGTVIVVRAWQH
ncbi:cbb3-type cytochrome c oxidase subunit I, partial [Schinkia azotoformans]|uniref:cbb3-type cytochrome c oxidase subunit I n=1 Tax=Schinkia azotoformans TaxID=1454 RepID=UPI002DBB1949